MIARGISRFIADDLGNKMVLLSGPRQSGKTTLSKGICEHFDYFNFDHHDDRVQLLRKEWDRQRELVIFDEIHKMRKWKSWLKGIYDKEGNTPKILVTGSARMDIAKKVGDSLAGRHFQYQLFPFCLKELKGTMPESEAYQNLMRFSGFPEPLLNATERFYTKWKRSHFDLILRQDLIDLESVRDISSLETLTLVLQSKIAAPFSYSSVREDIQKDVKTIIRWMDILENLYLFFRVYPFHKNIARSVKKEPKIYFYDLGRVAGNEGIKLENLVALSLKKEVSFLNECHGIESSLHTLRIKGGEELDFLVQRKNRPAFLIEVKLSDDKVSRSFGKFRRYFPGCKQIQLVKNLSRERTTEDGIEIRKLVPWLTHMDLSEPLRR